MPAITHHRSQVIVVGAGIGGLTAALLLAQAGIAVTVFESQSYPGGSASTFFHKGYRFDAGATIAGGFQPDGPHAVLAQLTGIQWNIRQHDPAWVVHLPDRMIALTQDASDLHASFPHASRFWQDQTKIANLAWKMSAQGLPFPPADLREFAALAQTGLTWFPADLALIPYAFRSVRQWAGDYRLTADRTFMRLLDALLLISAQTTSEEVNALYGATALDLPRQGVYHVESGIGGIARTLVQALRDAGASVIFKQTVSRIQIENGRAVGVYTRAGRRTLREEFHPADAVIVNNTPWSLDKLLGDDSPRRLKKEIRQRPDTQGAFVLHLGIRADKIPAGIADHHQIVSSLEGPMGEGNTLYLSLSPEWDASRAPAGYRAATVSTHTRIQPWWDLLQQSPQAYADHKQAFAETILATIDRTIPGFKAAVELCLPGTPVTYEFYTQRHRGMVGGFPQTSLFAARGPATGIPNIRLVGDSIFPGQSTAGVTLGGIRVARNLLPQLAVKHAADRSDLLRGKS